ncbi:MAG: hypothetical protein ABJB34_07785 [Acidobacteriota bacterium]
MQGFTTVPFKSESMHGLSHVNGVAKFSSAGVVLEFESKLFGIIGGGVKEVRLAKDDILDVKFRKGIFKRGAKIEIRTKTFAKLAELPSQDGKLTLKLVRDDFERAQSAVEQLQKDMSEHAAALPPPRSPVSDLFLEDEGNEETSGLEK